MVRKLRQISFSIVTCSLMSIAIGKESMPFPQQKKYQDCIKPTEGTYPQVALNKSVKDYYFNVYKAKYLKQSTTVTGGYYYNSAGAGAGGTEGITVSEQHGYGMMITALMAGPNGDAEAKKIFDGMYKFWKKFPSPESNGNLMNWIIVSGEKLGTKTGQKSSATDGDLDIAYAMLLAHAQWGGSPEGETLTYSQIAKNIISAIKSYNVTNTKRLNLGDWGSSTLDTRPSDWMPDHLRSFELVDATNAGTWKAVSDTIYNLIGQITTGHASGTGLMPDFVTATPAKPDATGGGTTGEASNTQYGWNACRYPWRIATDYAMWQTPEAKTAMGKVLDYMSQKYPDPAKIPSGPFTLGGVSNLNFQSDAFTAPFIAGAIVDSKYQSFLDKGWAFLQTGNTGGDAYNVAIKLMSMMVISGNWWKPSDSPTGGIVGPDTSVQVMFDDFLADPKGQSDLGALIGTSKFGTKKDKDSCGLWYVWTSKDKGGKGTTFTNFAGNVNLESKEDGTFNNAGEMMTNGILGFKINRGTTDLDYAGIGIGIGQCKSDVTIPTDYYNLSKMTAVLIRAKGTGTVRVSFTTKDINTLPADSAYGFYGTELTGLTSSWQTFVLDAASFQPEAGSPPANAQMKWSTGSSAVNSIGIDAVSQVLNLEVDYIKLCGVTNATFGGGVVISDFDNNKIKNMSPFLTEFSRENMKLTVPSDGFYTVAVYSLDGRIIQNIETKLTAGTNVLPWNGSSTGSKMMIVRVTGNGLSTTLKSFLK